MPNDGASQSRSMLCLLFAARRASGRLVNARRAQHVQAPPALAMGGFAGFGPRRVHAQRIIQRFRSLAVLSKRDPSGSDTRQLRRQIGFPVSAGSGRDETTGPPTVADGIALFNALRPRGQLDWVGMSAKPVVLPWGGATPARSPDTAGTNSAARADIRLEFAAGEDCGRATGGSRMPSAWSRSRQNGRRRWFDE